MPKLTSLALVVLLLSIPGLAVFAQDEEAKDTEAKGVAADHAAQDLAEAREKAGLDHPDLVVKLDRALPEVTFDGVAFGDVIDFLRDLTNTNIVVNWRALEAAGIDRNVTVNLQIKEIKFSKALQLILDSVGGDEVRMKYTAEEGLITITTAEPPAHARAYDVRDILKASAAAAPRLDAAKRLATLTKLITGSVAPDSWQADHVTAKPDEGKLIITQTPANHDAVANLLAQTRALLGLPATEKPAPVVSDR